MSSLRKNYSLTASDTVDLSGRDVSAAEVALTRLRDRRWGMYKKTRNKDVITKGDRLCVYASGQKPGGMSFIGTAVVGDPIDVRKWKYSDFNQHYLSEPPFKMFELDEIIVFKKPVKISDVRDSLSFIPRHSKWGVVMYGGCRPLSDEDFEKIVAASKMG